MHKTEAGEGKHIQGRARRLRRSEEGGWARDGGRALGDGVMQVRKAVTVRISKPEGSCWRGLRISLFKDILLSAVAPAVIDMRHTSSEYHSCETMVGLGMEKRHYCLLLQMLHLTMPRGAWAGASAWSPVSPTSTDITHGGRQISSDIHGLSKDLGHELPGRRTPWQRQAS